MMTGLCHPGVRYRRHMDVASCAVQAQFFRMPLLAITVAAGLGFIFADSFRCGEFWRDTVNCSAALIGRDGR